MKAPSPIGSSFAVMVAVAVSCACAGACAHVSRLVTSNQSHRTTGSARPAPPTDPRINLASGFVSETIGAVPDARELVGLPNGDLLVGTGSDQIFLVPDAENAGRAGQPHVFVTLADTPAQGVALSSDRTAVFASTEYDVFSIPYKNGDQRESQSSARKIASIRTGPITPGSDGDVHNTSSVAVTSTTLYVGVGSSCDACKEVDPTRATIQAMHLDGSGMHTYATRIRNPIALAIDPATNVLWAGGAGQDRLPYGHPYEFMDAVSLQSGDPVDYGWPDCEENRVAYAPGVSCANVAVPRVEFPAYGAHIGAVFYPSSPRGVYAFPRAYRGVLFVTSHGSWHCCPSTPPEVAYVSMRGDFPIKPVNWSDPAAQWVPFMWNFVSGSMRVPFFNNYIGRPTGIAIGSRGSLFVADESNGVIYRIRPAIAR